MLQESQRSTEGKIALSQLLTIYGRKPVLEALQDPNLHVVTLHIADSNKPAGILRDIARLAEQRGAESRQHSRETLSRISKNRKQDQGVALDIYCQHYANIDSVTPKAAEPSFRLLALDGITNPQNVGMIIRSAVAGGIDGIVYPRRGVAALGPLVIKASAGTLFRAPIVHCDTLEKGLATLSAAGFTIATLEGNAKLSLFDYRPDRATVYVMGGETDGVSSNSRQLSSTQLSIPMDNGVESLNVAVAASLIAYQPQWMR